MNKLKNIRTIKSKNPNPKLTVLLGDEHSLSASMEGLVLTQAGFSVKHAKSIEEIIKMISDEKIDIVILDYLFQKGQALKKIVQAKKISLNPKIRFVVTSVVNSEEYKDDIFQNNADLFLLKPSPKRKLIEELKKLSKVEFRKSLRVKCNIPFKVKKEDKYFETYVIDISADGLHVIDQENKIDPIIGMELEFEFLLPKSEDLLKAKGSVVRFTDEGFGIKFTEITKITKEKINKYVLNNSIEMKSSHYYLQ